MPVTATVALVAAAAMAGVPLLNGFLSKEMFFAETIFAAEKMLTRVGLPTVATVASMFSVAYSARFIHSVFFGPPARDLPREPHEPTRGMLAPSALLVLACLLVGIFPEQTIGPSLQLAVRSILGAETPEFSLKVWHGFTTPLLMSVLALAGGGLMYGWLRRLRARAAAVEEWRAPVDGKRAFDTFMVLMVRTSERLMRFISSDRLQAQLLLIVVVVLASALVPLLGQTIMYGNRAPMQIDAVFAALWLVGAACAIGAATQAKYHRLAALIMVGVAGLMTCLTFAWFSAPDLALTQIGVEVVTTVLLLLGLRWMPRRVQLNEAQRRSLKARARRARDLAIAVAVGAGMAALAFAILTRPADRSAGAVLSRTCAAGGRRSQRRQRHPRRLSWFRHDGRDHGVSARSRSPFTRCCADSDLRRRVVAFPARSAKMPLERLLRPETACLRTTCASPQPSVGCSCRWPALSPCISCCAVTMRPAVDSSAAW